MFNLASEAKVSGPAAAVTVCLRGWSMTMFGRETSNISLTESFSVNWFLVETVACLHRANRAPRSSRKPHKFFLS